MTANGTRSEEQAQNVVEHVFTDYAHRFQRYIASDRWSTEEEILDHLDRGDFLQSLVQELLGNRELYAAVVWPDGETAYKQRHLLDEEDRELVSRHEEDVR